MPPQFFVKFQYSDRIKKIGLTEDEFTWGNMAKILSQSFSIPKDRLKLTYKDPEGDEITACCDEDLIEAYRACSSLQPMRFFVYLCKKASSAKPDSLAVSKDTLSNSKSQRELEIPERNSEELKIKSEDVISDQICEPEKQKSLSEGALQASIENPECEKQVDVSTEEIGRILEEILLTKEAKEKILEIRKVVNDEGKNGSKYAITGDQKILVDCVTNIFTKVLNETIAIGGEEEKVRSINSIVESVGDHVQKTSMLNWKSMEEEKHEKNIKPSSENNLLNASLKESIYEKSTFSPPEETKQGDLQDTFAGRSMSFCRDLSTTYGVKLALRFENGKAKLLSVPTQEYSIIENSQQNDKSESSFKRSASMAECPNAKKSSPQDYSEYFRLSLVD